MIEWLQSLSTQQLALGAGALGTLFIFREKIMGIIEIAKKQKNNLVIVDANASWIMVKKMFDQAVIEDNKVMMNAARDMAMSMMADPKRLLMDGSLDE